MTRLKKGSLKKMEEESSKKSVGAIMVSLGTCGIAAGGDVVYDFFKRELADRGITDVVLKKAGCFGMCFCEPNLVIETKGLPPVLYAYVNEDVASKIVSEHILRGTIVNEYAVFMPAKDLICGKGGR
ncbi:MAG TPA: (2Fe-2S) ferredoxin domain-containing protein [bacterium]|nr:(2Fe-2S) ferredoxin domain-containing protein [bacterium]